MRSSYLAIALFAVAVSCKNDTTQPQVLPTIRLVANVTGSNTCSVNTLGTSYGSIGQIRGDVPTKFVGTLPNKGYHGFTCWVSTDGGVTANGDNGFINVIFSGNTYGKPLDVGTYALRFEILDDSPPMTATIRFHPASMNNDELRPLDNTVGNIVVDSTASGVRNVHIDLEAVRWRYGGL
ncbi:MAG: hypothetical protein H0W86_13375 [Armatimonadetes bacterium]|nr:hypothetical protein [Armatimonadota bacterium]